MKKLIIESLLVFLSVFSINFFGTYIQLDTRYIINYVVISIPQTLLIIYLISIRKKESTDTVQYKPLKNFGLTDFKPVLIIYIIITYFLIIILSSMVLYTVKLLPVMEKTYNIVKNPIPLIIIFSLVTGYKEEIFFRSYLLKSYTEIGVRFSSIAIVSTLLFGLLHYYNGYAGIIIAIINGFIFCLVFKKTRNVHVIAVSHALYNFTVLLFKNIL